MMFMSLLMGKDLELAAPVSSNMCQPTAFSQGVHIKRLNYVWNSGSNESADV
jgi:hypothetical protein